MGIEDKDVSDNAKIMLKLRQETGIGILTVKKALDECDWDYDKAKALLKSLSTQQILYKEEKNDF